MRVPAACYTKSCDNQIHVPGHQEGDTHGKPKVESDEEDGIPEVEGVVQVVVVDDDRGGEHDPDRDDGRGRQLVLWLWLGRGRWRWQRTAAATTDVTRDVHFRFRVEKVGRGGLVGVDGTTAILEELFGGHYGDGVQTGWGRGGRRERGEGEGWREKERKKGKGVSKERKGNRLDS